MQDGQSVYEYDLAVMDGSGQPWRRPGSDLSRWFNYGFDEVTWVKYCEYRRDMSKGREGLVG
jgi:pre-mRNA 3'-end-processing factor FIP1